MYCHGLSHEKKILPPYPLIQQFTVETSFVIHHGCWSIHIFNKWSPKPIQEAIELFWEKSKSGAAEQHKKQQVWDFQGDHGPGSLGLVARDERACSSGVFGLRQQHPGSGPGRGGAPGHGAARENWLRVTGQDIRIDNSCSWV